MLLPLRSTLSPLMTPAIVAAVGGGSFSGIIQTIATSGTLSDSSTPTGFDTTGCNLLILPAGYYIGSNSGDPTPTDTYNNTWLTRPRYADGFEALKWFYCINPVVGPNHIFTITGGSQFPMAAAIAAIASGTPSLDIGIEAGNNAGSSTSVQPGSITPSVNGALIVSRLAIDVFRTPFAIDSGFTGIFSNPLTSEVGGIAYLNQSVAAPVNPTWSYTSGSHSIAAIISFKPA